MPTLAEKAASMVDMLPEQEQAFAIEMLKRLVRAWDPDFTKLTPSEAAAVEKAERQIANGEYKTLDEIDWDAE